MGDEVDEVDCTDPWVGLGLNPLTEILYALGFGTEQHAKESLSRADDETIYRKTFRLLSPTVARDLFDWFRQCGLPSDHARQLVKDYGKSLKEIMLEDEPPHSVDDSTTSR